MLASLAADTVMALHFAFIVFALTGSFFVLLKPWVIRLHLPALAWGLWIELSGNVCPLTPLENHFRELAGEGGYAGGFIAHYIEPLIYPEGLTRATQFMLAAVLVTTNLAGYALVIHQHRRRRRVTRKQ